VVGRVERRSLFGPPGGLRLLEFFAQHGDDRLAAAVEAERLRRGELLNKDGTHRFRGGCALWAVSAVTLGEGVSWGVSISSSWASGT